MLPRKSSVAIVDYPIPDLPQGFPVTRRRSAAPFSLTRAPTTDTKHSTLGTSHRSKTPSSKELRPVKLEDTGYERAFFVRMGRKLSAFLPKGALAEHQESPVLRIKMRKEVHVATEEAANDVGIGSSGNEGPLPHKPPYLWKSPSKRIHGSHVHDSGVSLRPVTAPSGSAERRSRRKPVPLPLMDIEYCTSTGIVQSYPSCSEQPRPQPLPPTQSYSAVPEGRMFPERSHPNLCYKNTSTKHTSVVCATNTTSTPVIPPPVPPKRTRYIPLYQALPSSNTISTVVAKPPHLWKSPSEESIHGSYIHDSGVSLRPATAPGGSAERHSRWKPIPLSPTDIDYRTTTKIEQSYPSYSEQPRFQTLPPTRPHSAVPDGRMLPKRSHANLGHKNTSTKHTDVVCVTNTTSTAVPPPAPPRSPKRTQHAPHYQASTSPDTIFTVAAPIRPAQMRSLGAAWKSLFGGRVGKGKIFFGKRGVVVFARKISLKPKKGKATHSPYQPYSTRAATPLPVHTPRGSRRESIIASRRLSINHSRRLSRKRKSGLPSFLSIESSDSLT